MTILILAGGGGGGGEQPEMLIRRNKRQRDMGRQEFLIFVSLICTIISSSY
jgi:hypothetical protein